MVTIVFPDGSSKKFEKGITAFKIAESIGNRLAKAAVAAKVNGALYDMNRVIGKDAKIEILTFDSNEGKHVFWHSAAHIMASAVLKLFPKAKLTIGPTWESGFYYDIDMQPFNPSDLEKIGKEMEKIVKEGLKFERVVLAKKKALELFKSNKYKKELIKEIKGEITAYRHGSFIDLCTGPHVPSTGYIKAFKLTKTSGAYWRADSSKEQLQRIYGTAFPEKRQLDEYIKMIEEAEKRDHRKLGKELDLFSIHEEGPGFVFFHPKGAFIFNTLIGFIRKQYEKKGYSEIITPIILNKSLWERSGHWDHYKDNMYFTKIDNRDFAVKPMNCPGAILVYATKTRSYRELPLRLAEFGIDHRHELSGVLSGLFRVRSFVQDDAHIFAIPEQIKEEVKSVIDFAEHVYKAFNFDYRVELSTKPEKAMGDLKLWEKAESSLKEALKEKKIDFKLNAGDGAFYGPKIDFHIKDAIGRSWQLGTIQLDFQMPERFELNYEGQDGKKHTPVIIHRAILGSIERFMGILIEHYAGKFPLWLAPEQVRILTVADRFNDYAEKIAETYKKSGIRISADTRTESISYKVRDAQLDKIPYILVVGEKEIKESLVTVRSSGNVIGSFKKDEFLKRLLNESSIPS